MTVDGAIRGLTAFALAAVSGFVLTIDVFTNAVHDARMAAMLILLVGANSLLRPRLWLFPELYLYLGFLAYSALTLLWTQNLLLATNISLAMLNFTLIMVLFSQLMVSHEVRPALAGVLAGVLSGCALFDLITHFPLVYPYGMSYNTVAGMELFALVMVVTFGCHLRSRLLTLLLALVVWVHIVATTSIKTNLGIIIALFVVAVLNVRGSVKLLLRGAIPLAILIGGITYAVLSNPTLIAGIERGATRVSAGASLLLAREDDASNTSVGLSVRENWKNLGIRGWAENPVFGHGAEAFRADFGITSHSTPIDLLYNTGLIGIGLFYGIFAAMLWRWYHDRDPRRRGLRAIMLGITCCYLFISASGLVYYDAFLPAFVGIAAGLHKRRTEEVLEVPALELPAPT